MAQPIAIQFRIVYDDFSGMNSEYYVGMTNENVINRLKSQGNKFTQKQNNDFIKVIDILFGTKIEEEFNNV